MFRKKNRNSLYEEDNTLLMECMEKVISGDISSVDITAFHNKELGEKFNAVIMSFLKSNNNFVMRLNNSMTKIGDSSCVKEMIEQVNSQTVAINDMRGSSQDLDNSIQNIQSSVEKIQGNSHSVIETAYHCIEDMNSSIRIVDGSSERILKINDQISNFKEKAIKINEILDMVKKIAQKSGLLALNASIEAARAGEAGKGFAVVAEEVRSLAAKSATAAAETAELIEDSIVKVGAGSKIADETAKALDVITEVVQKSEVIIKGIAEASNYQSTAVEQIEQAITQVSQVVQTNSATSEECAAASEELSNQATRMRDLLSIYNLGSSSAGGSSRSGGSAAGGSSNMNEQIISLGDGFDKY